MKDIAGNNKFAPKESFIDNLTRIRDAEVVPGGIIYLLLELPGRSRREIVTRKEQKK